MKTRPSPGQLLVLICTLAALAAAGHGRALADPAPSSRAQLPPGTLADEPGPSPAIFAAQRLTVRNDHRLHIEKLGMTCLECHESAKRSRRAADRLLPRATRCDRCHHTNHGDLSAVTADANEPIAQCASCHRGYQAEDENRVERMVVPPPMLRFNHAAHHTRNIGCAQCHGSVEELGLATRVQMPRMRGCFRCHQMPGPARGDASGACSTCHLTDRAHRLRTELPGGRLVPPRWMHDAAHDADWLERHKGAAGQDSRLCANCHSEQSCADCHDGRVRPRQVHSNDWLSLHAVAGRQDNPRCTSCHRYQSFCLACHQRSGVAETGPYANYATRGRLHPPKSLWTDPPRSSTHHAWAAQRNLGSCVSCHVERDCTMCHATAARGGPGAGPASGFGQGTNPHPRGFRQRCRTAFRKNARPCLVCHSRSDPKLMECL